MRSNLKGKKLRKSRCFLTLLFCFIIISLWAGASDVKADDLVLERDLRQIIVEKGDTLWCLVDENYDYKGDIRDAIYEVREINGLQSSAIQCGQIIYIPTQ